jgi:hypothetical protein
MKNRRMKRKTCVMEILVRIEGIFSNKKPLNCKWSILVDKVFNYFLKLQILIN